MLKFLALTEMRFDDREPGVKLPAPASRRAANLRFFLTHDAPAVRRYRLDVAALKAAPTRIVPAAGRGSRQALHAAPAVALADRLGTEIVEFPGGHWGFVTHPKGFAAKLREVLSASPEA